MDKAKEPPLLSPTSCIKKIGHVFQSPGIIENIRRQGMGSSMVQMEVSMAQGHASALTPRVLFKVNWYVDSAWRSYVVF